MKRWIGLLMSLCLLASLAGASQRVNLTASTQPPTVQVLESNPQHILLTSQINGFTRDDFTLNGETYTFIGLEDASYQWVKGYPELPRLCRSVIIPDQGTMGVRILASDYRDIPNVKVAPSKGHLLRTVNPADVPFEFNPFYQKDAWFPEKVVALREPYILRDLRGQVVEINAFQYNPARQTLRVYTNLTMEVYETGIGGENVLTRTRPFSQVVPEFRATYQRHFLNFNPVDYTLVDDVGPLLIITYDAFHAAVQPLADWKNQKGIPTTIVDISTIGNNSTAIKNYITSQYQTNNIAYVLLVGDQAQVTSYMSGSAGCDPIYGQLTGSDHYLEVFIGRLSAENLSQVNNQVTKFLEYEKLPQAGAAWYAKGLGVASNQGVGQGIYGLGDWQFMNLLRDRLLRYGFTQVDSVYDPWGTQAMITNYVNDGRSMINYCGHGSATSWGTTGFSNTQVNALANDNKLPVMVTVGCVVGTFTGTTCFCEAWLRASHNGEPSGAVGHWGSSQNQSWAPPMYAEEEYVNLLIDDVVHAYGALCFNGASKMIDETGSTGNSETDHWNIFGDPSLQLRTTAPITLAVLHAAQINYGQQTFQVTVTGVQGALAALSYNGALIGFGYTNASGVADIAITGQLPPGDNVTLTVTSYNAMPYIVPIPVITGGPDLWPPVITHTPLTNTTSSGPYPVNATVIDYSGVASASIFWSTNGVNFTEVAMTNPSANNWTGNIPGQTGGTEVSYYLRAIDASPQANDTTSSTFTFLVLSVLFTDNMESGVGNWTHSEVSAGWADQWHLSTEISHSATHAWKFGDTSTGNYANHADGGLVSQVVSLGNDCNLTFWYWIAAEASSAYPDSAYDGGTVEISHNGGPWAVLPMAAYSHHIRSTSGGGNPYTGPFAPGTPVFSGTGSAWVQAAADLSAYVGDVQLRFRFGTDNSGNNEGWYVDDVQIVGLPTGTAPNVDITLTPSGTPIQIPASGGAFNFNVAVVNNEASAQTFDGWCTITLPNGTTYGPVLGPLNLTLPAGLSINRDRTQNIPGSAPAGDYSYNGFVGTYPLVIWSTASFPFVKLTSGDGAIVSGWANWGEDFGPWIAGASVQPLPDEFSFQRPYPNPFNPTTRFAFSLPNAAPVTLKIYNVQGQWVATLVEGQQPAGTHELTWEATQLPSGIYLYHLTAGSYAAAGKIALVK